MTHGTTCIIFTLYILCLQLELCDDIKGNDACEVLNGNNNVITDGDLLAVKQVCNFVSDDFVN